VPNMAAYVVREWAAPQGDVEQGIAGIWQELLNIERIGRHDSFFELGGHSLLAVQLLARVRERFGVEPSLKEVFEQPALTQLADVVTSLQLEHYSQHDMQSVDSEIDNLSASELMAILAGENGK